MKSRILVHLFARDFVKFGAFAFFFLLALLRGACS